MHVSMLFQPRQQDCIDVNFPSTLSGSTFISRRHTKISPIASSIGMVLMHVSHPYLDRLVLQVELVMLLKTMAFER